MTTAKKPACEMKDDDQEWIKFNGDTGGAIGALLVELAEGLPLRQVGALIVANDHDIPNFGRARIQTVDEYGNRRNVEAHVTEAHTLR